MSLQALFQALESLVHAVESLVDPVLVSEFLVLAAPAGGTVSAAFWAVATASRPSLATSGSLGIVPASSSHGTSHFDFGPTTLTIPGRDAA